MDDGSKANPLGEIDKLHAQIVRGTAELSDSAEAAPVLPAQSVPVVSEILHQPSDTGLCKEIIGEACETHRDSTYSEFYEDLLPIAGHAVADRIAKRAAMSPAIKDAYVKYGGSCAEKYGIAKFVDAETALVLALLMHWRGMIAAKKERDKILKTHGEKPVKISAVSAENPAKETQEIQPTSCGEITTVNLVFKEPAQ